MTNTLHAVATSLLLAALAGPACYTGHAIDRAGLAQLAANADGERVTAVQDAHGASILVDEQTVLVVSDDDGLEHPVRAFSYEVSATQLVAPEADLILGLDSIASIEVRDLSTLATLGLVGAGLATAATMGVVVVATAGDDSMSDGH